MQGTETDANEFKLDVAKPLVLFSSPTMCVERDKMRICDTYEGIFTYQNLEDALSACTFKIKTLETK